MLETSTAAGESKDVFSVRVAGAVNHHDGGADDFLVVIKEEGDSRGHVCRGGHGVGARGEVIVVGLGSCLRGYIVIIDRIPAEMA